MKTARAVTASIFTVGVILGTPAAASADDNQVLQSFCSTGRVVSIADRLPIRTYPDHSASLITTAYKGYQYNCNGWVIGAFTTACGTTNEYWVRIDFRSGPDGYTYSSCMNDV